MISITISRYFKRLRKYIQEKATKHYFKREERCVSICCEYILSFKGFFQLNNRASWIIIPIVMILHKFISTFVYFISIFLMYKIKAIINFSSAGKKIAYV